MSAGRVWAVVPTLGRSPLLVACLAALRREGVVVVVVDQQPGGVELPAGLAEAVVRLPADAGFAAATNRGLAEAHGSWVATVNDDCLVEPGWLGALLEALAADAGAAAAQGVNLALADPASVDGCGIAWNRWLQAVQIGRGAAPPEASGPAREIFGASATAALFRRQALAAAALPGGEVFDPRLGSYYEDVDLAVRLRAAGFRSLLVPAARARHAGSATGGRLGPRRVAWIYGNRHLVLARLLGRRYFGRLPALAWRDARDLGRALALAKATEAAGIVAGWGRALARLPAFAHRGPPALPQAELARFREARR